MKDMKAIRDEMANVYERIPLVDAVKMFRKGFDSASAIYEEREKVLREVIELYRKSYLKIQDHKLFFKQFKDAMYVDAIDKTMEKTLAETAKLLEGLND